MVSREPYEALFAASDRQGVRMWQMRATYPAFLVFLLLLAAAVALWWLLRLQVRREQEALFDRAVSSVMNRLERQVQQYEQIVRSLQGLYASFVQVVRDVFELYATVPARSNPAVLTISYAPSVDSAQLGQYIHYARSERYWDYRISPPVDGKQAFPLLYVVPVESASQWVGWNPFAYPEWRDAIQRAYQTGAITATPWIPLRTGPDTLWGIALVAPLYRQQPHPFSRLRVGEKFVEGVVIVQIAGERFFQQALATPAPTDSLITFEGIFVEQKPGKPPREIRVAESANRRAVAATLYEPALTAERTLRIGDQNVLFRFATVPHFGGMYQQWVPWLVLGGGIVTAAVGFGFVLSLVTARARAVALAERMTRAQRRILEASHDIIAVWELDGRWRAANPALQAILGYEAAEVAGRPVEEHIVPAWRERFRQLLATAPDEESVTVELPMVTRSGATRWIGWSVTLSRQDGAVYAIGRDITAQKELERRQELTRRQLLLAEQWALEASEFKTEFLSRLSFQLRNGLTGLMGFAELIAERQYSSPGELQQYAQALQEGAEYLLSLVSEVPEIAAATPTNRQPLAVSGILTELAGWAWQQGLRLSIPVLPEDICVLADEQLFQTALRELLHGIVAGGSASATLRVEANPAEGSSEWSLVVPASEALCRAVALMEAYPPMEALAADDGEVVFHLLLAQALLRRLRGELRMECVEGDFVAVFTLPLQRRVGATAPALR